MTLIASVSALRPESAVETAVSMDYVFSCRGGWKSGGRRCICIAVRIGIGAAGRCRRGRAGARGRIRDELIGVALYANHLLQFAELRELRDELGAVGRVERILVLNLSHKEVQEHAF